MALRAPVRYHQYRGNRLVTAPAAEPVTVSEVKAYLRITGPDDDTLLTDMIEEARQFIEDMTGLAMITQTWQLTLDRWPGYHEPWWDGVRQGSIADLSRTPGHVTMPRYPLQSISGVDVYAEDNTSTAVTVANVFYTDTQQMPGRMALRDGQTWPVATRQTNGIEITYVAGFGDALPDVPAPLKRAVKSLVTFMYENRGDGCSVGDAYEKSGAAQSVATYAVREI